MRFPRKTSVLKWTVPLFLVAFSLCLCTGFAQDSEEDISIIDVPEAVGTRLGVPQPNTAFVGGIFMTAVVLLVFVLPCMLIRNKGPAFIMTFIVLCFCVSIDWLPVWILLMVVMLVAILSAGKIKRVWS